MNNSEFDKSKQRKHLLLLKNLYREKLVENMSVEKLRERVLELTDNQYAKDNRVMFEIRASKEIGKKAFQELVSIADEQIFQKQVA